jgi:tungstate transport system substrate-binding protein
MDEHVGSNAMNKPNRILIAVMAMVLIAGVSLAYVYLQPPPKQQLILSTTTSVFDTGLLDYVVPVFEKNHNAQVKILSKGTGESLEIAKRGDADVVLVHSRELEEPFVNDGYGIHRVGIMYNDYIIIGPRDDPAEIKGSTNASLAFQKISNTGAKGSAVFISRADKSGTNTKELSIWTKIGIKPSNRTFSWYLEAGASMGTVLRMTNEKKAYTLTDRSTWLAFKDQLTNLDVLTEGDADLMNPYSIIQVNPQKYPQRNFKMAVAFAKFLISEEGQKLIAEYKKGGNTLFYSMARDFNTTNQLGFPNQEQEIAWYDSQTV